MTGPIHRSSIRKILIVSLTNLGDVILTTPVMAAVRSCFPGASITVIAGPKSETLLKGSSTVDQVIVFDKRSLSFGAKLRLVWGLRAERFDLVVDLRNTLIPYLIGARYGSKAFLGSKTVSMRSRHLGRLEPFGIPATAKPFDFFSEVERQSCEKKLEKLGIRPGERRMVIAPGAGSYLKRWGIERFGEVARYFSGESMRVVVVGSESEKELGAQIEQTAPAVNACGALLLRELAAVVKTAELVLSCDSAIMHLANELNVPCAAIFGPTDERKYARMDVRHRVIRRVLDCTPCERARCRFERVHCMEDITSENVIRICEELLDAPHD